MKVQNAVEFGKYFKFVLSMEHVTPHSAQTITKNAYNVLMSKAGQLVVWPEKYGIVRNNN